MANGRLAATSIEPKRTELVYDNTSGGAVSASILAKAISATEDGKISLSIDSSSVTPETSTNIDAVSRNFKETPLVMFDTNYTQVEGSLEFYNTNLGARVNDGATVGSIGTGMTYSCNMLAPSVTGYDTTRPFLYRSGGVVYAVPYTTIDNNFPDYLLKELAQSTPTGYTSQINVDYYGISETTDPYHVNHISFFINSGRNMSTRWIDNGSGTLQEHNSGTTWFSQYIGLLDTEDNLFNTSLMARGGILASGNKGSSQQMFLVYKGQEDNSRVYDMGQYYGDTGVPPKIRLTNNSFSGHASLKWLDYNPHTDTHYSLLWVHGKFRLLKFTGTDVTAFAAAHATSAQDIAINSVGDLDNTSWITEIATPSEWDVTNSTSWRTSPTFRVADKTWFMLEGASDNPSSNQGWISSDLENWTEVTTSSYYQQIIDDNTLVLSDADSTDKVVSNYSTVSKSGTLEKSQTFNSLERTGLVLSNGDKLYAKNEGDVAVAVQVMGYEE